MLYWYCIESGKFKQSGLTKGEEEDSTFKYESWISYGENPMMFMPKNSPVPFKGWTKE